MPSEVCKEYSKEFKILKNWCDNFRRFSSLNFDILNHNPASLPSLCKLCKKKSCTYKQEYRRGILRDVFAKSDYAKRPFVSHCPAGFKNILVPLAAGDRLLGFLGIGEGRRNQFNVSQTRALSELMFGIVNSSFNMEVPSFKIVCNLSNLSNIEKLKRAIKYIKENYYHTNISLRTVALNSNISYHYLSHLFKREFKITFICYLNQVRVEAACRMLKSLRLKISQISYAAGFEDAGYFSRVFKRYMRMSPLRYRYITYLKKDESKLRGKKKVSAF